MEFADIDAVLIEVLGNGFAWEDGAVGLDYDNYSVGVEYEPEVDALYLTGEFAGFDRAAAERWGPELLRAGLFGDETGGYAAFGYDAEDGAIVLWDRMVVSETDDIDLRYRLELFREAMEEWSKRFAETPADETTASAASPIIMA